MKFGSKRFAWRTGRRVDRVLLGFHRGISVLFLLICLVSLETSSSIWMVSASTRTGNAFRTSFPQRSMLLRRSLDPQYGYRLPQRVSRSSLYSNRRMLANIPSVATKVPKRSDFYADLNLFGKTVAGCVEILTSVAFDYCMGYASGYFIGTVLGVPRTIFFGEKAAATGDIWKNLIDRTKQIHVKSHSYGRSWGSVSAVFGGSRTAVVVIRGSKKDDWNEIFSSVLAGALMSRSAGPQAMLRSAVMYGGLMYLLSSGSKRVTPFTAYEEQLVDF